MATTLQVARTRAALRQSVSDLRKQRKSIGFVPTMGALHAGHLSLVERARAQADAVVASVFVNPAQFAPGEDFDAYPRNEARDLDLLQAAGCALAYCPSEGEMYPPGSVTHVRVEGLSDLLDGRHRPHFFYGVTTVVARLFAHVQPDLAVFGEKDYQQLQIIKRMTRDLGLPVEIVGAPTARAPDGLALSSRNAYLSSSERRTAGGLFAALRRAAARLALGGAVGEALDEARRHLERCGFDEIDYVAAVDPDTLQDLDPAKPAKTAEGRLLGAARLGSTRLIDNVGFAPAL